MDWAPIAAVAAAATACCAVLAFWMRLSERIGRADADAENALQEAAEAKEEVKELRQALDANNKEFSTALAAHTGLVHLFKEEVFKEYINRDALREMEERLTRAIDKSTTTSAEAIDRMSARIDRLAVAARPAGQGG